MGSEKESMIQHNKLDDLYGKIGGVYKTTVLIQKRLRELNRGARKLVPEESKSPIATVMTEIEQERIQLVPDTEENREQIRTEIERMTADQPQPLDLAGATTEEEMERKIVVALSKQRQADAEDADDLR
jgi:DNA-directed RNA polymerase subunit K/omega